MLRKEHEAEERTLEMASAWHGRNINGPYEGESPSWHWPYNFESLFLLDPVSCLRQAKAPLLTVDLLTFRKATHVQLEHDLVLLAMISFPYHLSYYCMFCFVSTGLKTMAFIILLPLSLD